MKVLLVHIDGKLPNLALMQIAAYHKSKGHEVGFNIPNPDKVYISCVFKKNRNVAFTAADMHLDVEVHLGGSGLNYDWLPEEMQKVKPDYDLYPSTQSMGFTTRGCIRRCPYCIVHEKEGKLQRWQRLKEFHDSRFEIVQLLDNNILADKEWFFENTDYILSQDLRIVENGMDIRLLDQEIADRLAELKFSKGLHFAFDNVSDEKAVRHGIDLLRKAKIKVRDNVQFYVLVGFNTTSEQDKYRCRLLKELGTNPFVMPYRRTAWTRRVARWANRKWLFWSCDIDDYKMYGESKKQTKMGPAFDDVF